MKILVACEYSGVVRDAFIKKGHEAVSCDILPTEKPGPHIQGDVLEVLNDEWDMMVAFPPCTHLAVSGAAHFEKKRADGRQQQGIDFFMKMINATVGKICVENPVCIMSRIYRKPDQIVHPYFFGDNYEKKTCFWLKNLLPLMWYEKDCLFESKEVEPEIIFYKSKKTKSGLSRYSWISKFSGDGKTRSKFPQGIADAMAEQWG